MNVTKDDIAGWRGGYPDRCSWCEWPCPPELLEPEESSMWVCHHCMWEWETCDIAKALTPVFGEPIRQGKTTRREGEI